MSGTEAFGAVLVLIVVECAFLLSLRAVESYWAGKPRRTREAP